jgi:hypothetical protein
MPQFTRYIGIDYSGAETAESSCKGLRKAKRPGLAPLLSLASLIFL